MNRKTVLWIALALLVSAAAYTQQYDPESDFRVQRVDGGRAVEITWYLGNRQEVRIPPRIQGLPVTGIGNSAFLRNSIIRVTIPNSVVSIGEYAFAHTDITSVTIPNSVTSIGEGAFENCWSLTSVTISDSVTTIGDMAFNACTRLTNVSIPNSVNSIGERAFAYCNSLITINVAPGNPQFSAVDGVLYDRAQRTLIQYPSGKSGAFTIPGSVTSIGDSAFAGAGLTSVTIPNSVTTIGDMAFNACTRLTNVSIPNSVTSIGDRAFANTSLTSVTIGNSVTSIGERAFFYCTGLTSVTIPNSVTSIGYGAFSYCTGLTSVTIPNSVTSIGYGAFSYTSLTAINVAPGNPQYSSLDGVLYDKTQRTLIQYPDGKAGAFTIPNSVTSIGVGAFASTGLTSVIIPNSVTSIGVAAFSDCTSLTSVTFGRRDTAIADDNTFPTFPGDLQAKYLSAGGGAGTYTRAAGSNTWTKQ